MRFSSCQSYHASLSRFTDETLSRQWIERWMENELDLVGDIDFAQRFSRCFDYFTARADEYVPRLFLAGNTEVAGGIRFFGGDVHRGFVDITGWSGDLDIEVLIQAVKAEWQVFNPFALRILKTVEWDIPGSYTDMFIYIQSVGSMAIEHEFVELCPADDIKTVHARVKERYDKIKSDNPEAGRNLFPATIPEIQSCYKDGTLDYICYKGERAGLLATLPHNIAFISGHLIMEEIIYPSFNGHGIASKAQGVLAHKLQKDDPGALLFGTINAQNYASQKTAQRAGRECVFEYAFVEL